MGEKIRTQDFVDENGRKDAQHCKERAGACLGHMEEWIGMRLKNETQWRTRTAVRATTVSLLRLSLLCSHVVSLMPTRERAEALGLRYSTTFSWTQAFYLLQLLPFSPNFHYKALHPVNCQWQYSTLPPPNQGPHACKDTEQLTCYQATETNFTFHLVLTNLQSYTWLEDTLFIKAI